jgi:hypothetical protein
MRQLNKEIARLTTTALLAEMVTNLGVRTMEDMPRTYGLTLDYRIQRLVDFRKGILA